MLFSPRVDYLLCIIFQFFKHKFIPNIVNARARCLCVHLYDSFTRHNKCRVFGWSTKVQNHKQTKREENKNAQTEEEKERLKREKNGYYLDLPFSIMFFK